MDSLWMFMDSCGFCMVFSMDVHGFVWMLFGFSMDFHGMKFVWIFYGCTWIFIVSGDSVSGVSGFYGLSWIFIVAGRFC